MLCSQTIRGHHAVTFSSKLILGAWQAVSAAAGWAVVPAVVPATCRAEGGGVLFHLLSGRHLFILQTCSWGAQNTEIRRLNYLPLADKPKYILWQKS